MKKAKGVLPDHRRQGKRLVAPFNYLLGPMRDVSWVNSMIPELCWLGLLHQRYGHRRAIELATTLARNARLALPSEPHHVFAAASEFNQLSNEQVERLRGTTAAGGELFHIQSALEPLVANYPQCPLRVLFSAPRAETVSVQPLRDVVASLYGRADRDPTMVQATAIWLVFDAGVLKVQEGLALAQFPEVEHYPDTELSRRIGGSIRSTLNMLFGSDTHFGKGSDWPSHFWNRGLALQQCEFTSDKRD